MSADISIVIPVHNGESCIGRTISRLIKQKNVKLEIILVENHSLDHSWMSCERLSHKYEDVVAIKTELYGTNRARYLGVQNSTGRWVTFMDQDDSYFKKTALSKMINRVEKESECVDIAQFGYFRSIRDIPIKKRLPEFTGQCIDIDLSNQELFSGLFFWTEKPIITPNVWSKLYRGTLIRQALNEMEFPLSVIPVTISNELFQREPYFIENSFI